jgi:hypothetical protein
VKDLQEGLFCVLDIRDVNVRIAFVGCDLENFSERPVLFPEFRLGVDEGDWPEVERVEK